MATEPSTTAMNDTEVIQVPEYFYAVDISYLTHMIADMLGRLISHNDLIPLTPSNLTRFHSRTPPNISLNDYLRRIVKYASVEKACLLVLLIYIDRVCELHPQFTISSLTVHRFLITAVTVSSKSLCDSYCTNSHYAKVGGISTQELNALELEFLRLIDWNLSSSGPVLQQYYTNLVQQHPCYERMTTRRRQSVASDQSQKTSQNLSSLLQPMSATPSTTTQTSSSILPSSTTSAATNGSIWKAGSAKRRRSSTLAAEEALAVAAANSNTAVTSTFISTSSTSNNNNNNNTALPMSTITDEGEEAGKGEDTFGPGESGNMDDEEQETIRHFDKLLKRDWIPYIA
ncbi:cyclin-domain-containing protein [Phascolomyces articulosus]|uniref:Cyclin-domain-containing protein n=1 Tax=Phascolomyces articulosus TaxID=60185 RepID=A0AAD5KB93_9FUNG|nr:cyclin-domain-containing protein [Phascolomyces articulosus]